MPYKYELPVISKKQTEIIDLVFQFRFINREQIQKLLGHTDPRRINAWLKDLVEKKYLGRIYSFKLLENTKPAIYYLANNGISYIQHYKEDIVEQLNSGYSLYTAHVKKFYQDKTASQTFINHCIALSQLYVLLKGHEHAVNMQEQESITRTATKSKTYSYDVATKSVLWLEKQLTNELDECKEYLPDLFIEKVVESKRTLKITSFFVILFDNHVPRYAMRYKVKQYIHLYEETEGHEWYSGLENAYPILLFILPNKQKLRFLRKFIKEQLAWDNYEGLTILLTTLDIALKQGITGEIWEQI